MQIGFSSFIGTLSKSHAAPSKQFYLYEANFACVPSTRSDINRALRSSTVRESRLRVFTAMDVTLCSAN